MKLNDRWKDGVEVIDTDGKSKNINSFCLSVAPMMDWTDRL
jgi:hypothetical protein